MRAGSLRSRESARIAALHSLRACASRVRSCARGTPPALTWPPAKISARPPNRECQPIPSKSLRTKSRSTPDPARGGVKANSAGLTLLCQDVANDVAVHVGEPEVAARVAVGQLLVIEPHEMQDRGVEVVDVDFLFAHGRPNFIGRAISESALDPAAGQPGRENGRVMAAAFWPVGAGRAAELGRPHD